jgi:hypothetical protein
VILIVQGSTHVLIVNACLLVLLMEVRVALEQSVMQPTTMQYVTVLQASLGTLMLGVFSSSALSIQTALRTGPVLTPNVFLLVLKVMSAFNRQNVLSTTINLIALVHQDSLVISLMDVKKVLL